jgi:hypothetical protein
VSWGVGQLGVGPGKDTEVHSWCGAISGRVSHSSAVPL